MIPYIIIALLLSALIIALNYINRQKGTILMLIHNIGVTKQEIIDNVNVINKLRHDLADSKAKELTSYELALIEKILTITSNHKTNEILNGTSTTATDTDNTIK